MRRFGIIFFIIALLYSFHYCNINYQNKELYAYSSEKHDKNISEYKKYDNKDKITTVEGVIKNKYVKKYYTEYYIDDALITVKRNFKYEKEEKSEIKLDIGDIVVFYGEKKDLDDLFIKDFDYGKFLRGKGITLFIQSNKCNILGENKFYKAISYIKNKISDVNKYLYKYNSEILNSLVIGDRSSLDNNLKQVFEDSGTSHIMAISGLHVGIICGFFIIFIGNINQLKKLLIIFFIVSIYGILVGGGVSISRAIFMMMVLYVSFFVDRRFDMQNTVYIVASIFIFKNPYIIYNISFLLSFGAVLSIGIFNKYIKHFLYSNIISITVAANILTIPIIIYFFKRISTISIIGNIVSLPFIPLIILLDIISVVFWGYLDILSYFISKINMTLIDFVINLLDITGNYGVNTIQFSNVNIRWIIIYYIIISLINTCLEIYFIETNKY